MKRLILIFLFIVSNKLLFSQPGWNWPDNKSFAKKFLAKNKIATADYKEFKTFDTAKKYILDASFPLVVKADGLAAGKGVMICQNKVEALKSIEEIMKKKKIW